MAYAMGYLNSCIQQLGAPVYMIPKRSKASVADMPFSTPVELSRMTDPFPPGTLIRLARVGRLCACGTLGFVR